MAALVVLESDRMQEPRCAPVLLDLHRANVAQVRQDKLEIGRVWSEQIRNCQRVSLHCTHTLLDRQGMQLSFLLLRITQGLAWTSKQVEAVLICKTLAAPSPADAEFDEPCAHAISLIRKSVVQTLGRIGRAGTCGDGSRS